MAFRKIAAKDSSVPMIIVALLIGVLIGFSSGWELSALQHPRAASAPAAPLTAKVVRPEPPVAVPPATPDKQGTEAAAMPIAYRGVVDAVTSAGLKVTVKEGALGEPQVTLLASGAKLVALRPAPMATQPAAGDTSKGLPPPPKPPENVYKEEPMKLSSFREGDVVEFSTADTLAVGASVKVAKVTWIMNIEDQAGQPGPMGDGTAAPPTP